MKCPVCGSELKSITMRHINSAKHKNALEEQNIDESDDPTLELIKESDTQDITSKTEEPEEKEEEPEEKEEEPEEKEEEPEEKEEKPEEKEKEPKEKEPEKKEEEPEEEPPKELEKVKLSPMSFKVEKPQKVEVKPIKKEPKESEIYASQEYMDLDIPDVPEPPKQKKIKLDAKGLEIDPSLQLEKISSDSAIGVLVNCQRCKHLIQIPVPKELIANSRLPVTPISFIHKNKDDTDPHCLTLFIDRDFDIRRQRISEVIISDNFY